MRTGAHGRGRRAPRRRPAAAPPTRSTPGTSPTGSTSRSTRSTSSATSRGSWTSSPTSTSPAGRRTRASCATSGSSSASSGRTASRSGPTSSRPAITPGSRPPPTARPRVARGRRPDEGPVVRPLRPAARAAAARPVPGRRVIPRRRSGRSPATLGSAGPRQARQPGDLLRPRRRLPRLRPRRGGPGVDTSGAIVDEDGTVAGAGMRGSRRSRSASAAGWGSPSARRGTSCRSSRPRRP